MTDTIVTLLSFSSLFFMLFCGLLYVAVLVGGMVFWVYMLLDAVQRENYVNKDDRTTWILIIALTGLIGAAIYYFTIKKKLDKAK